MKFDLVRPCSGCPFLGAGHPDAVRVTQERMVGILDSIETGDLTFPCHKTTYLAGEDEEGEPVETGNEQHCAGALVWTVRAGWPNWRIRFAAMLGLFRPELLDLTAAVPHGREELLNLHHE